MRTTVSIDDELLTAAKRRARERGEPLGRVIEAGLRRELAAPERRKGPPIPVFRGGNGPLPGVDLSSNRAIYALLDELDEGIPRSE